MGYENNTYISPKGREYTNHIFDMLFNNNGVEMDLSSIDATVGHFRGPNGVNLHTTTQLMKKFIKGYQTSSYSESFNSGIHVCPHCNRRDFMWTWQYVDFGIRNDDNQWTDSIKFEKRLNQLGGNLSDYGYRFTCRVRCNTVTTCNDCHVTTTGSYSNCRDCGSSDVVVVGCGQESYVNHIVNEVQTSEWLSSEGMRVNSQSTKQVSLLRGGTSSQVSGTRPFFYRIVNPGPSPEGLVVSDPQTAFKFIPQLEVGYETYDGEHRRPYGYRCPNDDCNFERYAPVEGEPYMPEPMSTPSKGYAENQMTFTAGMSSGMYPTVNQDGSEAQGGLVDNMGYCPNPTCGSGANSTKLVPRQSLKEVLPKVCFSSGDTVKGYRTQGRRRGKLDEEVEEGASLIQERASWQINRAKNMAPDSYPFSPMTRAFTRVVKEICLACYDYRGDVDYYWSATEGILLACKYCKEWKPEFRRTDPKQLLNPPLPLQIVSPQPLVDGRDWAGAGLRVGSNPESKAGTIWGIRLECNSNPEYGLLQNFLQLWSLNEIPDTPTSPPMTGQGIQICPNDVAALKSQEVREELLAEKAKESSDEDNDIFTMSKILNLNGMTPDGTENLEKAWKKAQTREDVPGYINTNSLVKIINVDPDSDTQIITSENLMSYRPLDEIISPFGRRWTFEIPTSCLAMPLDETTDLGVTSPGYTFVVTEGRSKEAFKDGKTNKWVDASGPCISYQDRLNPKKALTNPITYPRWTQTPESHILNNGDIIDAEGDYEWNHTNHFVQDFLVVNDYLSIYMTNTEGTQTLMSKYHDFHIIGDPLLNPEAGSYTIVYECKTCKAMYDIGVELQATGEFEPQLPVLQYYQSKYMANDEGKTLNEDRFPQVCLDAEMENFPEVTDYGVEDAVIQGMGRGGGRTAKEMLENPKLTVKKEDDEV